MTSYCDVKPEPDEVPENKAKEAKIYVSYYKLQQQQKQINPFYSSVQGPVNLRVY